MLPLFKKYPALKKDLPYVSLGELPTPVKLLKKLGKELNIGRLYMKLDGLSGKVYGGNKVRKLEFLLGEAKQLKAKEVLTFGFAGSNHALATAIYAKQVGLRSVSILMPQPNAEYARRNLLMSYHIGAELHQYKDFTALKRGAGYQLHAHRRRYGVKPVVIPAGGSAPLGVIGFVNAAFELSQQVKDGGIPEPDFLYVAMGTMGTVAGLIIGLKAAGLRTKVVPVCVVDKDFANADKCVALIRDVTILLLERDPRFPQCSVVENEIQVRHEFLGKEYGRFTRKGNYAVRMVNEIENIQLEGTYTGKAFAAVIDDAQKGYLKKKTVLFWNTYNVRDFSKIIETVDYHQLPRCFHRYFEVKYQ